MNPAIESTAQEKRFLTREEQALIAAVRGDVPPGESDLNWNLFVRLARIHCVAQLLHKTWGGTPGAGPPEVMAEFARLYRQSVIKSALGMRQCDEVLRILRESEIPVLILKGTALARTWYGDVALRPFHDIDVYMPASAIPVAAAALLDAGYEYPPGQAGVARSAHHAAPLRRPNLPCEIELHRDLTSLPQQSHPSFEELNERAITLDGQHAHIRTLSAEDTLLHLCAHLLEHVETDSGWRLQHFYDVARHLDAFGNHMDWEFFAAQARAVGHSRVCGAVLGLTVVLTGVSVPSAYVDEDAARELLRWPLVPYPSRNTYPRLNSLLVALSERRVGEAVHVALRGAPRETKGPQIVPTSDSLYIRPRHFSGQAWRLGRQLTANLRPTLTQVRSEVEAVRHKERCPRLVHTLLDVT